MSKIWETISAAPAEAWVGLIGVIFGSVLAILTAWLTSKANRKQLKIQLEHEERMQRQRLAKGRLEELYVLVSKWHEYLILNSIKLRDLLESNGDWKAYRDMLESDRTYRPDYERMEMIVKVYCEEAQAYYAKAEVKRDAINLIYIKYKRLDQSNLDGAVFLEPLRDAIQEFREAARELKECIAKVTRSI